jgi:hypothetical protein
LEKLGTPTKVETEALPEGTNPTVPVAGVGLFSVSPAGVLVYQQEEAAASW